MRSIPSSVITGWRIPNQAYSSGSFIVGAELASLATAQLTYPHPRNRVWYSLVTIFIIGYSTQINTMWCQSVIRWGNCPSYWAMSLRRWRYMYSKTLSEIGCWNERLMVRYECTNSIGFFGAAKRSYWVFIDFQPSNEPRSPYAHERLGEDWGRVRHRFGQRNGLVSKHEWGLDVVTGLLIYWDNIFQ